MYGTITTNDFWLLQTTTALPFASRELFGALYIVLYRNSWRENHCPVWRRLHQQQTKALSKPDQNNLLSPAIKKGGSKSPRLISSPNDLINRRC